MEIVVVVKNIKKETEVLSLSRTIQDAEELKQCFSDAMDELSHRGMDPAEMVDKHVFSFMTEREWLERQ